MRSRRGSHDRDEVPEYWITYSDLMVSLLMAFALLLFIVLGREQARANEVRQQVAARDTVIRAAAAQLDSAGRSFHFDSATGTLAIGTEVLFAFGSAHLAPEARGHVELLATQYLPGLLSEAVVDSLLQEIVIEGHTDTIGTYLSNLRLSQERAFSVMQAVLDASSNGPWDERIRHLLTASGRSETQPKFVNGSISDAGSRRIEVRLRFRDDELLRGILAKSGTIGQLK